jgi:hypothetical protein
VVYRVISAQSGGVVNASGTNQPPDGTYSTNDVSRRTFLKGVGLAGAAGLTSLFLATPSALASGGIILGVQAPGPWAGDGLGITYGWTNTVTAKSINSGSHALGCRSYRDAEFNYAGSADGSIVGWWNHRALGSTTGDAGGTPIFPGEDGSIPLASIRPQPSTLFTGLLDGKIKDMIRDGARRATPSYSISGPRFVGTPQLTVWHEAGHLYQGYDQLKPDRNPDSGVPRNGTSAATVRQMHVYMKNLVDQVNNAHPELANVQYGCIIYGDVIKMANDNDLRGPTNWVPTKSYPMDWYGIDLYYEGDGLGSDGKDCTHPDLATYTLVSNQLNTFQTMARGRANGSALRINICECNAKDDSVRPAYFDNLALWLYTNAGYRMLTFFPDPPGPHSVTWASIVGPNSGGVTLAELNSIQRNYGR